MKRKLPVVPEDINAPHAQQDLLKRESSAMAASLQLGELSSSESAKAISIVRVSLDARDETKQYREETVGDHIAVEEPLEIRLVFGPSGNRQSTSLSITMRTPGHDFELALGFLVSEGIISQVSQVQEVKFCGPETRSGGSNIVKVTLSPATEFSLQSVQRHFYTTSSCGICGKASLDAVQLSGLREVSQGINVEADLIVRLPEALRSSQEVFQQTGGLHASGVFDLSGNLLCLREDVGRHNALDKILGASLEIDEVQQTQVGKILVVSGRASFELVQKAIAGRFEIMVAVGAPSSLAVDLADRFGVTLIGFASPRRFNIYSHPDRIRI